MTRRRRFNRTEDAFLAREFIGGRLAMDLATEHDCSTSAIYTALRREGVHVGRDHPCRDDAFSTLTPCAAYWIGFLLADGHVSYPDRNRRSRLVLSLQPADEPHVLLFADFIGYQGAVERTATYTRIGCSSPKIVGDLAGYGVGPRKSLTATPDPRLTDSRDFWRGVIDGDGSVAVKAGGYPSLALCGTEAVCDGFRQWVSKHITTRSRVRRAQNRQLWLFELHGLGAGVAIRLLYDGAQTALARKMAVAQRIPTKSPRFNRDTGPMRQALQRDSSNAEGR